MRATHFRVTLSITAAALFLVSTDTYAVSSTASANATATVILPIGIVKTADLQFGRILAGTGGTVVIDNNNGRVKTGGVTLMSGASVSSGDFTVSGEPGATYAITLPADGTVILAEGGGNTMAVNSFTSSPSGAGTLSGGGTQTLKVGATLTVANAQAAGSYANTFTVSVDYN